MRVAGVGVVLGVLATAAAAQALPAQSTTLQAIATSASTGEKPQSKVWRHAGTWWSVIPDASGTWLRRLDGTTWSSQLQLSTATTGTADVKAIGDVAHVLLYRGTSSELVSVEYVGVSNTYQPWSSRPTASSISLDSGVEIATIDVDSQGRMWLASDGTTTVLVRYSDPPYSSWSGPITLATGISTDDISVVTALPNGTVGVLWSNQNTQRFGFRLHTDGDSPATWAADEVPASQSALNVGLGMADDHLNFAVASDSTVYAAVKTSYDTGGYPKIALLVRRPNGTWDNLYQVDTAGTRAIALLNESAGVVSVIYTSTEGAGDIVFKESPTSSIAFGARSTLIGGGNHNDVTSTKQNITDQAVLLTKSTSSSSVDGVLLSTPVGTCGDGAIGGAETCDDGNTTAGDGCSSTCTVETCFACTGQPSVCTPDNGAACNDGLFCNGADTCSAGACVVHAGNPCVGPDGDANCAESCDEAVDSCTAADPNGSACNDGLFCNGSDTCNGGACGTHAGNPCVGPDGDANCAESCDEAVDGCTAADPNGSVCNDGLFCNGSDTCGGGACGTHAGNPCAGGTECADSCNETADDCFDPVGTPCTADTNVCTNDECSGSGACTHPNNTASCNDGLFCNGADTCSGGSCSTHAGNPCTGGSECADACSEAADNCFDTSGTPCTADTNVCTNDQCNGSGACTHPNNTAPCDDGLFCNGTDTCAGGSCGHSGDPCVGGTECNDACNEAADNCFDASGTSCTADTNVCTDDQCNGSGACTHPNNTAPCDDGLFCNGTDTCAGGSCGHSGDPCAGGTECNDACNEAADNCFDASGTSCTADTNVCTDDQCNGSGACAHANNTAPCNDGLACTTVDVCAGGVCTGNTPPQCDDLNPCTQDSCDDATGCVNLEEPASGCFTGEQAQLQVRDNIEDAKDQLRWKWRRGEVTTQEDFGAPATTTAYTLCVYDTTSGQSSLATSLEVDPNGAWLSKDPKGWLYNDKALLEDGVQQIKLKPGAIAGKSSAQIKARGVNVPIPAAVGSELFDQDPSVTVQLHNSDGKCWTSQFTTSLKNSIEQFKARTP